MPLTNASLPIMEDLSTTSSNTAKEPIIELLTIEELMVECSPMVALGPMIEFSILQPSAILTGGKITVLGNW
ncbi:hypothetical protein FQZ97_1270320 [compost metagenome]